MNNDITSFMSDFLNSFATLFTDLFNLLKSITFGGTSLLAFFVTICIIGTFIPIIISSVRSYNARASEERRYQRRRAEIREERLREKEGS